MNLLETIASIDIFSYLFLSFFAFLAGFIDAVVGGGGLIQLPALLIQFPQTSIATLFGTNKIAAFSGTFTSAIQYGKRIQFHFPLLLIMSFFAAISSYFGAKMVNLVNVNWFKPIILVILIIILIYTISKKDLGDIKAHPIQLKKQYFFGGLLATILGFYDGFFGPGTGSFFVLGFVLLLGFDFLRASAYAKFVNSITNISALLVFLYQGNFILTIAIIMAISNIIGNVLGTKIAIKKGNKFIRIVFIIVVSLLIIRYGYDIVNL